MTAAAKDEKSGRPWRRISATLLFAGVLMAALAFANSGRAAIETPPPPSVWSDKADYAPGEQVTLSGANWATGESVHIRVNDDAGETWRRDVDVTAAEDGIISDQFNLPDWFVAVYTVTATGASSGTVTWTFTDAVNTNTTVTSSLNPSTSGDSVTFTSTTTCTSACTFPAGSSVRFAENANNGCNGGTLLGTATTLTGSGNSRQAAFTTSTLSAGTHSIRACFDSANTSGSNAQSSVSAPITQTVDPDTTPPDTSITAQPSNPSSSSSATFSFTGTDSVTSASSLTFQCKLDGGSFGACTSPKNYSGLSDGSHTFQVRAIDAAGNTDASPASYTWVIDTIAPNTTITAQPSNPSNSSSASFSFTGSDPGGSGVASFECKLDGGAFAPCTSPKNYSGFSNGSHTFQVRAIDAAGNADASPASYTWFIDTIAPNASIDTNPSDPSNDASPSFTFSGTDNHSAAGALTFECQLDSGGWTSCTSPKSLAVTEGSHTFEVRATDEAGNTDATPASYTWFVDTTAPITSIDTNPSDPTSSTSASFTFSGTDNHSAAGDLTFECELDGAGFSSCSSPQSSSSLAEGSHTFKVRATDEAGNTDATPASFTWFVDLTAPETSIDSSPSDPSNDTSPSFTFSGTDNHSAAGALTFECRLDSAGWAGCTSPETVSVAQGSHTFEVRATDEAGNIDATPASYTWFADTTAPDVSINSNPSNPTNSTAATFTFSATDNHSASGDIDFECQIDGGGFSSCTSPKTYLGLSEGSHTFDVTATDEAGNDDTASYTWFIDTTAPETSIDSNPSAPTNSTSAGFGFSGTDNHSAAGDLTFECELDGAGFSSCSSPQNYSSLAEGSHTFEVRAADEAGNTDATPASYTWFVDTTAPETSIDSNPSDPTNSTSAGYGFSGTDNHSAAGDLAFECELDGDGFSSCTSPQNYSGLAEGSHTFKVRATDEAGNTDATPASFTWFVDTTAPNTSIDSNPSDPSNDTAPSFTFSGADDHSAAGALTFECQLDSGGWTSCTSPKSLAVTEGSHTFEVRAADEAGNTDATPASYTWFVDTTAPDTTIGTNPSNPSNSSSASFIFSGTDNHSAAGDLTFECELDGGGFSSCSSPKSYSGLGEGSHTFKVRATDEAGNADATPASFTWVVDTVAPNTIIDSNPSDPTSSTSANFAFHATDAAPSSGGLHFECKLDGAGFSSCTSPQSYSSLADGSHTFHVRAIDAAGNTDATPASFTWFVDTTAPNTSIDSNPSDPSNDTSPSFTFSGTDNHSAAGTLTFECRLDSGAWAGCSSPKTVSVAQGSHTFEVRATDEAGNTDPTPASYTWFVDTTAPDTTITSHPSNPSNSSSASFSFSGTDNHSAPAALSFKCELDGGGFSSCSSSKSYSGLADGSHTFKVKATDEAGNTDATPDSFTWTVDTTGPSITLTTPPNGAVYTQGQVVNASYSCSDSSGVATCLGTVANLAQINTATIGSKSFTVNATDNLGNASSVTHNYTVVYNFSGFFSPVDNPPICNVVKAGQAVPIKFSLHGNQGMNIFATGSPSSQPGTCAGLVSDPVEETSTAGQSTLNYDAQADQYVYVWKTEKSWAGTARLLTVTLADGTKHLARFTFTK